MIVPPPIAVFDPSVLFCHATCIHQLYAPGGCNHCTVNFSIKSYLDCLSRQLYSKLRNSTNSLEIHQLPDIISSTVYSFTINRYLFLKCKALGCFQKLKECYKTTKGKV